MKKYLVVLLSLILLTSCSSQIQNNSLESSDTLNGLLSESTGDGDRTLGPLQAAPDVSNGGSTGCQVHGVEYHAIPISLVNYVGKSEAIDEWVANVTEKKTAEGCPGTNACIYNFIHHFEIPKKVFIELYNEQTMRYDYPIDLLYSGTADDVDAYYKTFDEAKELEKIKWDNLNELKMDLTAILLDQKGETILSEEHSIIELANMAGISEKEILSMEALRRENKGKDSILSSTFDYDMGILNSDIRAVETLIAEHSAYYLDCVFCGITPYETPYERQVGELKE